MYDAAHSGKAGLGERTAPEATVNVLHTLVILPCDTEAHNTLGLRKPLEHFNKFWALLDSWLESQEDLLNGLEAGIEVLMKSAIHFPADVLRTRESTIQGCIPEGTPSGPDRAW